MAFASLIVLAQLQLTGPPVARIGVVDGDTLQSLYNVTRAHQDRRGNLYVIQFGVPYVAVFDSSGNRIATLGRAGGGPGEFAVPSRASFLGDSVWIADASLAKFSVFSPAFEHVRDVLVHHRFRELAGRGDVTPSEVLPDGTFVVTVVDSSATYYHVGPEAVIAELLSIPEGEYTAQVVVGERLRRMIRKPITSYPFLAHDGHAFRVIERHRPGGVHIRTIGADAAALVIPLEQFEVSDEDIERSIANFVARVKERYPFLSTNTIRSAFVEAVDAPGFSYYVERYVTEPDGSLWIEQKRGSSEPSVLFKLDFEAGGTMKWLRVPPGMKVLSIDGDHGWVLEHDDDDVPFLYRYRLGQS